MPIATEAGIEVFSPLSDPDILEACRVVGISGKCDRCGQVTDGLHCPECCHGTYCCFHCPVCTGRVILTEDEREAMRRNRDAQERFVPCAPASGHDGRGQWPRAKESCGRLPPDALILVAGTSVRMHGRRKLIYSLIEDGMRVEMFVQKCHQAGLPEALANLRVLARVYGAVRITCTGPG